MKTIQIKTNIDEVVLFEYETPNNTIKKTIEEAVRRNVCLYDADLSEVDLYRADLLRADLHRADFFRANLREAILRGANLCGANLCGADLRYASLCGADLSDANLCGADLNEADLRGANLRRADLRMADLYKTNLHGANLRGADLYKTNLYCADLSKVNLQSAKSIDNLPFSCPSDGAFIGWKKVKNSNKEFLIKLEIPEDAKRCSATSSKCRCDKAMVLSITDIKTGGERKHITNTNHRETTYTVGEMVYPDFFDDNRWNECSNGIHFFINKQEAINYYL